jgi:hypothetical protein
MPVNDRDVKSRPMIGGVERPTCETGLGVGGARSGSIATVMITRSGWLASLLVFSANPLPLLCHDAATPRAPHRTKTINSLPIILLSHRNQGLRNGNLWFGEWTISASQNGGRFGKHSPWSWLLAGDGPILFRTGHE